MLSAGGGYFTSKNERPLTPTEKEERLMAKETPRETEARWIREERDRVDKLHELAQRIRPICETYGGQYESRDNYHTLGENDHLTEDVCHRDGYEFSFVKRWPKDTEGSWQRIESLESCAYRQMDKEYKNSPQYLKDIEEDKKLPKGTVRIRMNRPTDEQIKRGCFNK